jgi:hypothetical protein
MDRLELSATADPTKINHRPARNDEMPKRCSASLINLVDAAGFCSASAQRQDRLFNRKFT